MIALFLVAVALKPPVIHEPFTVLPCPAHPATTLDMEACAEHRVLATDRAINTQVRAIFDLLPARARSSFVSSELTWQRYRRSSCAAEAGAFTGGSIEPLVFANCLAARNRTHLADLRELRKDVAHH